VSGGRFERCMPSHSWNSNHTVSNVFLYHLQRHSDHHAHPTRRFQALRSFDTAPNLPSGYATMILVALVPPLWRRVMDGRVEAHYGGNMSLANVQQPYPRSIEAAKATGPALGTHGGHVAAHRFQCPGCGYVYDERQGHAREGFAPGTPWASVPETWHCPDCGVRDKVDFTPMRG